MPSDADWDLVMSFWIDTPAYSDRDRAMFVAGVEFQMIYTLLTAGWQGTRPIRRENESRVRMMAAKLGRRVSIKQHEGCDTWSELTTEDGDSDDE